MAFFGGAVIVLVGLAQLSAGIGDGIVLAVDEIPVILQDLCIDRRDEDVQNHK